MNKEDKELLEAIQKGETMLDLEDNQQSKHAWSMRFTLADLYQQAKERGLVSEPDYPKDLIY